jgi:Transposase zinc-ribbon domain
MTAVHYYLGRPARVWISAHSPRSPARQARTGSGHVRSGHPSDVAPAGGLLARQRIAIARFGADVAAAGGIGPALAAGLDPAGYPVVPGGVPQAWERAQVYLGLCERYQELYQAQVAELRLLMATAPGCSLPLSHRRPPTDPLTDTHTSYISLISGTARRSDAYDPPVMHIGGPGYPFNRSNLGPVDQLRAGRHYPRSAGEFQSWFGTDADCLDYLEWLRWPDGFACPACGGSG